MTPNDCLNQNNKFLIMFKNILQCTKNILSKFLFWMFTDGPGPLNVYKDKITEFIP